ncbi:MAG TPA: MFS transporter [Stenotrophomonas sp.]|nr:MFS transporter [Stenotrophomonas sp.]
MNRVLASVLTAHFLSAFAALGMPVFLSRIIGELAPDAGAGWAGALYVLPTLCAALSTTAWGRFADRHGRKLSLLRAQLGLAAGFAIAGFASDLPGLALGLLVQGFFGGSLAAANAYLAVQASTGALARALDWTQYSARLALVSAPVLVGIAMAAAPAQSLYRVLALLPLLAFVLTCGLPTDRPTAAAGVPMAEPAVPAPATDARGWGALLLAQFLFCFALVVGFPYFVPFALARGASDTAWGGVLFSLPHLAYLALLPLWRSAIPHRGLVLGLLLFAIANLWQSGLNGIASLFVARLLAGLGMSLCLRGLNQHLAGFATPSIAGRVFGRFDACGKWAGVAAGLAAASLVQWKDDAAPFQLAATTAATAALVVLLYLPAWRTIDAPANRP